MFWRPTLSTASKPDTLLDDTTPKVGINQALSHLCDRRTQGAVGQLRLAHPAAKVPGFKNSLHDLVYHLVYWFRSVPLAHLLARHRPTSTSYILFYVAKADGATVIRVLHHARDVHRALF